VDTEKVRAEAAEAERQRCIGIQSLAAPGFEQEVAAALANGDSVEATGLTLFQSSSGSRHFADWHAARQYRGAPGNATKRRQRS
jgi:hypothetical protein